MLKFVGRQRELQVLDTFYKADDARLLVLYGRRRVGKTSLLTHWLDRRNIRHALFWTATTHGSAYQLREFSQTLLRLDPRHGQPPAEDYAFRNWETAFHYLIDLAKLTDGPFVVVIDEFTHLVQSESALPSILQKVWDHALAKQPNIRLVLTGSLVGVMENEVLSVQAPLYGRAQSILRLTPLPFGTLTELFPQRSPDERVAIYAVCGGVPAYLNWFTDVRSFSEGMQERCLAPGSLMFGDAALLLSDQLRGPHIYASVLGSIAFGFHTWRDVARIAGVPDTALGPYLKTLQALEMIQRREPVLTPGERSGQSRYYIRDPFLRFYYRFIPRYLSQIERGDLTGVVRTITNELRAFIGKYVFEELCREWIWAEAQANKLGFQPDETGGFWKHTKEKGTAVELDVVAVNSVELRLFIGEAKWETGQLSRATLTNLIERSRRMPQAASDKWTKQFALFAREGFTPALRQEAARLGARLIDLREIEARLSAAARQPRRLPKGEILF